MRFGATGLQNKVNTYVCLGEDCSLVSCGLDKFSTSLSLKFRASSYSSSVSSFSSSEESTIGRVFRPYAPDETSVEAFEEVEEVEAVDITAYEK